jgi:RNA polymerase sigma-70 factor (ECF subfamily)
LRSARRQRETYFGPWLPEPAVDEYVDLADRAALSDSLSTAFLIVLERLSPDQRAVFLLHDVFGYSYDEVATMMAKSQAACRQIAVRARRQLEEDRPRFDPSRRERDELAGRFLAACREGELAGLLELLAADATFIGDGGGKATGFPRPVYGRDRVARLLLGAFGKLERLALRIEQVHVGGHPALRMSDSAGRTIAVWSLLVADGVVVAIQGVVNPEKLGHLQAVSGDADGSAAKICVPPGR